MLLHLLWGFITPPCPCPYSLPGTGRHPPSGVHVCASRCAAPQSFSELPGQSFGCRTPSASWFPDLHVGHLLHPDGHPELRTGPTVAAAPRWSLEGVEEQQLAQSALSGVPAGSPAAEHGAEPHGGCVGSVRLTVCGCTAPLSKAAGQALLPPPVVFPGEPNP